MISKNSKEEVFNKELQKLGETLNREARKFEEEMNGKEVISTLFTIATKELLLEKAVKTLVDMDLGEDYYFVKGVVREIAEIEPRAIIRGEEE